MVRAATTVLHHPVGVTAAQVRRALDPLENLRSHVIRGGPAPDTVAKSLGEMREEIRRSDARLSALVASWRAAARVRDAEVARLIASPAHEKETGA